MKLTKTKLRQIVREEVEALTENVDRELKRVGRELQRKDYPFAVKSHKSRKNSFMVKWMQDGMNFEEVVNSKKDLLKIMKMLNDEK